MSWDLVFKVNALRRQKKLFDDNLIERFELASERIKEIKAARGACSDDRFSDYFCKMSEFIDGTF